MIAKPITQAERSALVSIKDGGDVYDRATAIILRGLEKRGLVNIVKAVMPPSGEQRQPYFGVIATRAGCAAIAKATGASR